MRSNKDNYEVCCTRETPSCALCGRAGYNHFALFFGIILVVFGLWSNTPARADTLSGIQINRPPGRLIDIGTHRLYLYCVGKGSPTVVLDAGLGGSSLELWPVQRRLAVHTRACAYDRAGYGWSDPGPAPRTSLRNALELHALLARAGIPPPYVLAGHSFGGYDVQLFASLYPHSVAGIALMDSAQANQVQRFEAPPISVITAPHLGGQIMLSQPALPRHLPASLSPTVSTLMTTPKALLTIASELQYFRLSARQVANAPPWPDVPVVVLTRGQRVWPHNKKGDLMESLWMQLQNELAARNPRSLHIVVRNSGHHIHLDQPEVVARAIELILDEPSDPAYRYTPLTSGQDRLGTRFAAHTWADETLFSDLYPAHASGK